MNEKSCNHCYGKHYEHSHEHGHDHSHSETISRQEKVFYVLAIILFVIGFIPALAEIKVVIYAMAILLCGYKLLKEGIINIFKLNFKEDTLMTIAAIAAFILGEYPEAVAVILLFKLGEYLEAKASKTSNNEIENISKIKAENANLILGNNTKVVDVKELKVGDKILIKAGEKVPVDSKIIKGKSTLDTSSITGESKPQEIVEGNDILSGTINLSSAIECEVIRNFEHSTASQIVDLVYEATNNKGKTEKFITKFSKIYTPIVIALAIIIAILPPLIFGLGFVDWIKRGLVFLVASCPCSLVISVPLAFFACIGAISKKGMLVKGTKHIEKLSKITAVCFDKTGTLTTGKMQIDIIQDTGIYDKNEILTYIYSLEKLSNHPISTAIMEISNQIQAKEVKEYKEIAGMGLYGKIDGKEVVLGNKKILRKFNVTGSITEDGAIYLGIDGKFSGYITLKEEVRKTSENIVKEFSKIGIKRVVMLTGDNSKAASKIASQLNIKEKYSELLPKDKLEKVNELKNNKEIVLTVGDGINDSPVLATADFGVSMGEGTEIASNSADGILLSNNVMALPNIIKTSKSAMNIVKANIAFSIIIKIIVLTLGVLGMAPIWLAVLADTGVTALTVINSMRILKM